MTGLSTALAPELPARDVSCSLTDVVLLECCTASSAVLWVYQCAIVYFGLIVPGSVCVLIELHYHCLVTSRAGLLKSRPYSIDPLALDALFWFSSFVSWVL